MFHDPDFTPFASNERPSWRSAKSNFLENWPPAAYRETYFTLEGIWPFVGRTHYLADPELIEEMLVTRAESFARDFITVGALSSVINRDALFFVEGADWKWQRRALAPAFRHEIFWPLRRHSSIAPKPRRTPCAPRLTLRQST